MELLSPAGSREALEAAVQSGADAVYMGFGAFNARRSAKNFTDDDFAAAVHYCHLHGVKVYLTLNTLLTDRELPQAADALKKASAMGVDAVLVQDWGLWHMAREAAPDVPLHASTQMSLFTLGGANFAAKLGMERVVLARELSARDIETICRACPAEVEVFGHGALCMCYSGQCEMSAVIGSRSGNRGACAQPCRLPYGVDGPCRGGHPLSLKDANLSGYLRQMEQMGVACVKLEGRMKRPEYVAVITGIYRRLIDERRAPTREESQQLERAFSRSGFTDGYWRGRTGAGMFGVRPDRARWPEDWFAQVRKRYENGKENRPRAVTLRCTVRAGQPAQLEAVCGGCAAAVEGPVPEAARSRALTAEELQTRLGKTGGTAFRVERCNVALDEGLMLPASAVNALRRDALAALERALTAVPERRTAAVTPLPPAAPGPREPQLTCSVSRADQLSDALAGCAMLYLPLEILDEVDLNRYAARTKLCAVLPRVFRTEDEALFREKLQRFPQLSAVAVGNLGHLPIVEGLGLEVRGDFGLNVFNSRALAFLRELGLASATVSFELRHQQVRDLAKLLPCEGIVYGRLPLMVMENCITKNNVGCRHGAGSTLTDRTGAQFPVQCVYGCRNEIENSLPLFLADKAEWRGCGLTSARLRFTTETADECAAVLRRYRGEGDYAPEKYTRGLFYRGVE